ncbi:Ig-like domain-containing protein [Bacillus sp. JJ664]
MKKITIALLTVAIFIGSSIHSYAAAIVDKEIFLTKRSGITKDTVLNADRILNGELFVSPKYPFYKPYKAINWKEDPYKNTTWRLYYQSLDTLSYLTNAYEVTKDPKYLTYGFSLIQSFWKANGNPARPTDSYTYNAHALANRTNNLLYFYHYYISSPIVTYSSKQYLKTVLRKHGTYLNSSKYYNLKTNHGYFQDRSLFELASYFPEETTSVQWKSNAVYRTKTHIKRDFTPEGLHKEHSPQYFLVVLNLVQDMNKIAEDAELTQFLLKEQNAFSKLVLSNFTIPRLGDSDQTKLPKTTSYSVLDPEFEYVLTKGKQGKQPSLVSNISNSVAVIRDGWGTSTSSLLFTTSNFSTTHKHADDLSFILTQKGKEIFTDSGKYNYDTKDAYQKYLRSTFAHNVVTVDGKSYPISSSNVGKAKMTNFIDNPDHVIVMGEHTIYNGVRVYRTIVYLKNKKVTLIQDEIISDAKHKTNQVFNIGQTVSTQTLDSNTVLLNNSMTMKQHVQSNLVEYYGQKSPIRGFGSTLFNNLYPIKQLDFESNGNNVQYFTSLSSTPNTVSQFSLNEDLYTISMSDGSTYNVAKPMTTPFVNKFTNLDIKLNGFTQGGANINVLSGQTVIATGQATTTGNFAIDVPLQLAGTNLTVVATSKNGQYTASGTVTVKDEIAPDIPTINTVSANSKIITGKAEGNAIVIVKVGNRSYTTKADKYGKYQIRVTMPIKKGTNISVSAKDLSGNMSDLFKVKAS